MTKITALEMVNYCGASARIKLESGLTQSTGRVDSGQHMGTYEAILVTGILKTGRH